jgi:hypothetical protein
MISYFLCSVIETIIVKTTCFAITQTINIGINCGSYLVSQLFLNSKRNRRKLIYMEDIIIHDVKMMDNRSKYIDYNSDSDSDYESGDDNDVVVSAQVPYKNEMNNPYKNEMNNPYKNESTSAYTMHDDMRRKAETLDKETSNADSSNADSSNADSSNADSSESECSDNIESLNNQVQIIKDIINDKKYLNDEIKNEIRKKEELDEYLKNEYDKKVKEEIDNEWVSIQIFE